MRTHNNPLLDCSFLFNSRIRYYNHNFIIKYLEIKSLILIINKPDIMNTFISQSSLQPSPTLYIVLHIV